MTALSAALRGSCLVAFAVYAGASANAATFVTIDPSGSEWTVLHGINASGVVVGEYASNQKNAHGFIRAADATITKFDAPHAIFTTPLAINDDGRICGEYTTHHRNYSHSFVRETDGTITEFDPPHALGSTAMGFDAKGDIAGTLDGHNIPKVSGYIRASDGTFTVFNYPGALATGVLGINSAGTITGDYVDQNYVFHGYVRATDGSLTSFDVPGGVATAGDAINDDGAIAIFANGAKGHSALQLSRDLDVQYKTAFVMAHKLREAMGNEGKVKTLSGAVEVDGGYFGGYIKPANQKEHRRDLRLAANQNGKRECVVVMRERNGNTLPYVCKTEDQAVPVIRAHVAKDATVYADEASMWNALHTAYDTRRVNHSVEYANGDTSTNWAESYFSRLRRAEIGTHHKVAGPYLAAYAGEMAWREDARRMDNGRQFLRITRAAAVHPVSRQWKGYWQRRRAA